MLLGVLRKFLAKVWCKSNFRFTWPDRKKKDNVLTLFQKRKTRFNCKHSQKCKKKKLQTCYKISKKQYFL